MSIEGIVTTIRHSLIIPAYNEEKLLPRFTHVARLGLATLRDPAAQEEFARRYWYRTRP
jgi:hypothetical protein